MNANCFLSWRVLLNVICKGCIKKALQCSQFQKCITSESGYIFSNFFRFSVLSHMSKTLLVTLDETVPYRVYAYSFGDIINGLIGIEMLSSLLFPFISRWYTNISLLQFIFWMISSSLFDCCLADHIVLLIELVFSRLPLFTPFLNNRYSPMYTAALTFCESSSSMSHDGKRSSTFIHWNLRAIGTKT